MIILKICGKTTPLIGQLGKVFGQSCDWWVNGFWRNINILRMNRNQLLKWFY